MEFIDWLLDCHRTLRSIGVREWIRAGYRLNDRLLPRYRLVLAGPPILGFVVFFPAFWLVMELVANALGIGYGPVRGHPMSHWFFLSIAVFGVLTVVLGWALGSLVLAAVLRYVAGWSWHALRGLMVESRVPSHWLISER
jgi:hypothetical protein